MTSRQQREIKSILNAHHYLSGHKLAGSLFAFPIAVLADVLGQINPLLGSRRSGDVGSFRDTIRTLIDVLRSVHMIPVSRRGRLLFDGDPIMLAALRVPHVRTRPAVLVAAAYRMIERLEPELDEFVYAGFSPGFLDEMKSAADELKEANREAKMNRAMSPENFAELRRLIRRGRKEVAVADSLMQGWIRIQPAHEREALTVSWNQMHRVGPRLGRPPKSRRRSVASDDAAPGDGGAEQRDPEPDSPPSLPSGANQRPDGNALRPKGPQLKSPGDRGVR